MGHVIAVMPASGGVGATTLAAAVAVRAEAAGRSVAAVDLDMFGGRLDVVLGVEQEPGWRWDRLGDVAGLVDGAGLARELPRLGGVAVLSGRVGPDASLDTVAADVVAGLAAAHDVTVLDVPRDAEVIAQVAAPVDVWLVVVGTCVSQLGSAAVSVPLLRRLLGAARQGRWRGEPWVVLRGARIDPEVEDAVMDHLDVPVVASVRDEGRVVLDVASGRAPGSRGRGAVVEAADAVLLRLLAQPAGEGWRERAGRSGEAIGAAVEDAAESWRWSA